MPKNKWRFGNKDDSKNERAGGDKAEDAATLVEQEDGEGDDEDGGGEEDGRGVAKGKPGQSCQQENQGQILSLSKKERYKPGKRGEDEENTKAPSGSNCC